MKYMFHASVLKNNTKHKIININYHVNLHGKSRCMYKTILITIFNKPGSPPPSYSTDFSCHLLLALFSSQNSSSDHAYRRKNFQSFLMVTTLRYKKKKLLGVMEMLIALTLVMISFLYIKSNSLNHEVSMY